MRLALLAPLVLVVFASVSSASAQCLRFGAPRQIGAFQSPDIVESSGLAVSILQAGVRFTHNDSGDSARVFAVDATGADLGAFEVRGASARDWEDIALAPCELAGACLYIADMGDNGKVWETVTVYRGAEPQVGASVAALTAAALELTYPDGARDAEALLVDPQTTDLFIVEKTEAIRARVTVLRGAGALAAGAYPLEAFGELEVVGLVTGGDFDPTGREVILRTYGSEASRWLARRDDAGQITGFEQLDAPDIDAFGEAVAYRADGLALLTTREGEGAPLYETPCINPDGDAEGAPVGPLVAPEPTPKAESSGCGGDSQAALLFLPLLLVGRRRRGRGLGLFAALVLAPSLARAEVQHEVYGALAGGVWPAPEAGGHGVLIAQWRARGAPGEGTFTLSYNTDTLRVRYDDVCFSRVCLGAQLAGEAIFAGLLPDYYQGGRLVPTLGLNASYLAASGFAELRLPERIFLRYTLTGRKWFFGEYESLPTFPNAPSPFAPPPEAFVAEQALALTYWQVEPDPSQWEAHRLFPRVRGLAVGIRGELHLRTSAAPWGTSTPQEAGSGIPRIVTERNDPSKAILLVRQWARFGAQVTDRLRLQLEQRFAWGRREDDLTRDRIGGLNPYVVPLGGAPWAAFVSGRYLSGRVSTHVRVVDEVELGAFFDALTIRDIGRTGLSFMGADDFGEAIGTGAFVDARFGDWQVDAWFGYAPGLKWGIRDHYLAGFVSVGARLL